MAIFRVNKTKDYVTMSKTHLKEKNMSLKAKGLLSEMLGLPNEWDYSINGLVSINKENESAIKSTLAELKEFGYLKVTKLMPNVTTSGRIEYIYDIYEKPIQEGKKQGVENQPLENQPLEIQAVENPTQLNNKELNNKELNNNINKYFEDEALNKSINEWFEYKKQRKSKYTDIGKKKLVTQIKNSADIYGVTTVVNLINECIANNYQGIVFGRLDKPEAKPKFQIESVEERNKRLGI